MIAYSYKDNFCSNTESIFVDIFYLNLSQSHWVSYIDHSINQISLNTLIMFTQKLDKQECCLLGNLNINLTLHDKEFFSNKSYKTNSQNFSPLTTSYLDFCFSFSLEQLISILTSVPSENSNIIYHVLTKLSQKN